MAKGGLGKGLEALFPTNVDISEFSGNVGKNDKVVELNINEIEPDINQPRKSFDKDKLNELTESIKEHGVIQPIIVSKRDNFYQIIAGERRWRASKKAGLKTIPVIVREYDERKTREVSLIENIQRQDLNALDMAKAIKELMIEHNLTQEELAKTLGKSRSAIANTLRILNLDERVQEMVQEGKLTEGHARTLASIESPQKQYKLAMDIVNLDLSVRDAENLMREEKKVSSKVKRKVKESKFDIICKDLESKLKKCLGTKVSFRPTTKSKGKIVIEYFNSEELERILETLGADR